LLRKYEVELRRLKWELEERNRSGGSGQSEHLSQLQQEKLRAEQEKSAAINALELRSKEYLAEREEKKRLEEKIKMMNSQMLVGGKLVEDTPQFRTALEAKQKLIRQEYELKL
jgi:kinesin family protein 3/17